MTKRNGRLVFYVLPCLRCWKTSKKIVYTSNLSKFSHSNKKSCLTDSGNKNCRSKPLISLRVFRYCTTVYKWFLQIITFYAIKLNNTLKQQKPFGYCMLRSRKWLILLLLNSMKYKEVTHSNVPQETISVIIIINFIYVSHILFKSDVKSQPWKEIVDLCNLMFSFASENVFKIFF